MAGGRGGSYELTRNPRPYANLVLGLAFVVTGAVGLGGEGSVTPAVVFVGVGLVMLANAAWIFRRWPTRVAVSADGLRFTASSGVRFVPWSVLRSVRVSRGRYGGGIRWRLADRHSFTTAATFNDLHRLLVEVERHAPQALIVS